VQILGIVKEEVTHVINQEYVDNEITENDIATKNN
jgi:hypothetical protein